MRRREISRGASRSASPSSFPRASRTPAGRCWLVPSRLGGGVLFIASTDDNRFRAFDSRTGRQLWVTKMERRGNANPITYQGRNGKQYVAVVATDTLRVFALP